MLVSRREWVSLWFSFKHQLFTHYMYIHCSLLVLTFVNEWVTRDDLCHIPDASTTIQHCFTCKNPVKVITDCTVKCVRRTWKTGDSWTHLSLYKLLKKRIENYFCHLINSHEVSECVSLYLDSKWSELSPPLSLVLP